MPPIRLTEADFDRIQQSQAAKNRGTVIEFPTPHGAAYIEVGGLFWRILEESKQGVFHARLMIDTAWDDARRYLETLCEGLRHEVERASLPPKEGVPDDVVRAQEEWRQELQDIITEIEAMGEKANYALLERAEGFIRSIESRRRHPGGRQRTDASDED